VVWEAEGEVMKIVKEKNECGTCMMQEVFLGDKGIRNGSISCTVQICLCITQVDIVSNETYELYSIWNALPMPSINQADSMLQCIPILGEP